MPGASTEQNAMRRFRGFVFVVTMVWLLTTGQSASAASTGSAGAAGGLYRIAGTIVNRVTGEPVRRATVALLAEADSLTVDSVESDNEGRFAMERLPAAKYQLTASKRGYRTAFYDEHEEFSTAIVTGEGKDTGGLIFRLIPNAALRGVVTADGGDPVEGARVLLFLAPAEHGTNRMRGRGPNSRIAQADSATTDDTGAYEFSNLAAGQYLLAVTAEPWYALHRSGSQQKPGNTAGTELDVAYATTFYDSTTDETSATQITLGAGSTEEANISLHAVPALRLTVEAPAKIDGSIARPELRQSIFGTQISAESEGFLAAMKTGTVEFNGVAPGHYQLAQGDPARIVELDATVSQQVDRGEGTPTVSVSGTLRTGSGRTLPDEMSVALYSVDGSLGQGQLVATARKGSFRFDAVLPGKWELWAWGSGKVLAIVSVSVNGKAHAGNVLTVRDRPLSIAAAAAQGETRVEGFAGLARASSLEWRAGVMVVLVPRSTAAFQGLVRRDQSNSDGSFSLPDVAPGQYTVVAIEDGWELDWTRPEVMGRYVPKGIAVTVSDSSGKRIELPEPVQVQTR